MKKAIERRFKKIDQMIKRIEEYNEYLNDNKYYEGYGHFNCQLSFDVKLHSLWLSTSDVEEYIKPLNLTEEQVESVMKEFNEQRLEGIYYHFLEDCRQAFIDDLEECEENPLYGLVEARDISFYGRQGGHMCLGRLSEFELEIGDTEIGNFPIWEWTDKTGLYWSLNKDTDELITKFKEYFEVTTQKELYRELQEVITKGDLRDYYAKAIENQEQLERFEEYIKKYKADAKGHFKSHFENEINNFLEDEQGIDVAIRLAESGDYSRIDKIKEITEKDILTERNARVPLHQAKKVMQMILTGKNVIDMKIGHFVVNRVEKYTNDTYIKIGCHLFSLNQTRPLIPV